LKKYPYAKVKENLSRGMSDVPCGQMDRWLEEQEWRI